MSRRACAIWTCLGVAACVVGGWCAVAPSPRLDAQDKGAADPAKQVVAFLAKHCYACHGPEKKKAGVALHIYKDEASILKDRKRWQDVLHVVTAGEMPPPERPRPKVEESEAFVKAANAIFEKNDRNARRDPGRVTMRRLNRTEYNNTIRDLVGVDFQPADDFPSDDVGYGFDNIGDVLTVSPLLMERYLAAAESIVTRPGSRRALRSFFSKMALAALTNASLSSTLGRGRSGGGISPAVTMCNTSCQRLRSLRMLASSL